MFRAAFVSLLCLACTGLAPLAWAQTGGGTRPAAAPAATPAAPANPYLGRWEIPEPTGDVFYINVRRDGTASGFFAKQAGTQIDQGTWALEGERLVISWPNGFRDVLERRDGNIVKLSFAPGTSLTATVPALAVRRGTEWGGLAVNNPAVVAAGAPTAPVAPATEPAPAPATIRSNFVGFWEVEPRRGEVFYLEVRRGGLAYAALRNRRRTTEERTGTWTEGSGAITIVWQNGARDTLRQTGESFALDATDEKGDSDLSGVPARRAEADQVRGLFEAATTRIVALADFLGFWESASPDGLRFFLDVRDWQRAERITPDATSGLRRTPGTWSLVGDRLTLTWEDGQQEVLALSPQNFFQISNFAAGMPTTGTPRFTAPSRKIAQAELNRFVSEIERAQSTREEERRMAEARARVEAEARERAEAETRRREEEAARVAATEAARRAAADARAAEEARRREAEAQRLAAAEANRAAQAAREATARQEAEARRQAEEQARLSAAEARRTADAEAAARRESEAQARRQSDAEAARLAATATTPTATVATTTPTAVPSEAELRRQAEELNARQAREEAARRAAAEAQARADAEARRRLEAEEAARARAEARAREAEERRAAEAARARREPVAPAARLAAPASSGAPARPGRFTSTTLPTAVSGDLAYRPLWNENFDGDTLSEARWLAARAGTRLLDNEMAGYTPEGVRVRNGSLFLSASATPTEVAGVTLSYRSGAVFTGGRFSGGHGYYEARVKVPEGPGLRPVLWLVDAQGQPIATLLDMAGQEPDRVIQGLGLGRPGEQRFVSKGFDLARSYHSVGVLWTPTEMIFYINGQETGRATTGLPTGELSLLAALAVGTEPAGPPTGWTPFPANFEIEAVRVFRRD